MPFFFIFYLRNLKGLTAIILLRGDRMNSLKSKRKQLGLTSHDVATELDLPWLLYVYYELRINKMPLHVYIDLYQLLNKK